MSMTKHRAKTDHNYLECWTPYARCGTSRDSVTATYIIEHVLESAQPCAYNCFRAGN